MRHLVALASVALLTACGIRAVESPDWSGLVRPTQEGTDPVPVPVAARNVERARLVPGDEIDDLEARLKPPARFAGYAPRWRVEKRTFAFRHLDQADPEGDGRIETKDYYEVVLDGDKVVALLRSGDIQLIARTPETARTTLEMPTERFHLDNLLGPSLPTHPHVKAVKTHGSIYAEDGSELPPDRWETNGTFLAYVRERRSEELKVTCRYVFTVDPVYGYRIDAERELDFRDPPVTRKTNRKKKTTEELPGFQLGAGTFCNGCYVPWSYHRFYDRTAYTPSCGGIKGWANNLVCMDRCDDIDRKHFDWRDGGFIGYLPGPDGWSPCFTRKDGGGPTRKLAICNAHNDFHITIWSPEIPKGEDGRYRFRYVHRLLSLPPEMSRYVWEHVDLIQQGVKMPIIKLGAVEDFEDQPVALTEPARGLVWTSHPPPLVDEGRGGGQCLKISGRSWPNLPQVSLIPGWRYRLQAHFKLVPWDAERIAAEQAKDATLREKLAKEGKELPPAIDWADLPAKAYLRGDFYEWSPYANPMVVKSTTPAVTAVDGEWHVSTWEFTAPKWGPNINLSFHAEYCDALMDDFIFTPLPARVEQ